MPTPDIIGAIAADPNVSPAFRAALGHSNWTIFNRLGQPCNIIFATSAEAALAAVGNPNGYTARLQTYPLSAEERAVSARIDRQWGRLD